MYDMSIRKRAAALITAAAITASFAGCADTSYVMKADDETINAGIYIDYMFSAMQQQLYMWQYTGVTENYFDQKVDDKDFATYLLDEAMTQTKRYAAVEKLFKDSGLKISSDGSDTNIKSFSLFIKLAYTFADFPCVFSSKYFCACASV